MHVLLTEDNSLIASGVIAGLQAQGFTVAHAASAAATQSLLQHSHFDLLILDLGLPDEDGLALLQRLRRDGMALPVLILTARDAIAERVAGLQAGADDYLTKPFHPEELALRIQALLRRAHGLANQPQLEAAGLQLDESRQCVTAGGEAIDLTAAEFRLLRYFMLHPGRSCPRVTSPTTFTTARQSVIPTSSRFTSTACAASSDAT